MNNKLSSIFETREETEYGFKISQPLSFHAVAAAGEIILSQAIDSIVLSVEQAKQLQALLNEVLVEPYVEPPPVEEVPVEEAAIE